MTLRLPAIFSYRGELCKIKVEMLIKYFSSSSLNVCVWLLRNINFPLPWKLAFPYTFFHSFLLFLLLLSSHVWLCVDMDHPLSLVLYFFIQHAIFFYCQKWNFFRTLKRQTNNKEKKEKCPFGKQKSILELRRKYWNDVVESF